MKPVKLVLTVLIAAGVASAIWYFFKRSQSDPVSGLKPRVEMSIVHITDVTDSTLKMELKTLVYNPLPLGMDLKGINYVVRMNDRVIVEDRYNKPLSVNAADSSVLTLPAKIKIRNLRVEGDEEAAKGNDSADYRFETVLHFRESFFGRDSLLLTMDKRLPLYRLPQVEMAGYDVKKLGFKESDIVVKLEVTNRNAFSVEFQNPVYVVDLGKQKRFAEGKVTGITKVKGGSQDVYEVPLSVGLGKVIKAAGQLIGQGKDLPFTFYFKTTIISENQVLNGSDMNLIMDGSLKDISSFQKNMQKK